MSFSFDDIQQQLSFVHFVCALSFVILVVWEHCGTLNNWTMFRPSVGLDFCATTAINIFERTGEHLAHVSSFYKYLQLHDLGQTLTSLLNPVLSLTTSPIYTCIGYFRVIKYEEHPFLIVFGTATLVFNLLWLSNIREPIFSFFKWCREEVSTMPYTVNNQNVLALPLFVVVSALLCLLLLIMTQGIDPFPKSHIDTKEAKEAAVISGKAIRSSKHAITSPSLM